MNILDLIINSENNQPHFTNPSIILKENKNRNATVLGGIGLARELIKKLNVVEILNTNISVFKRHAPYFESDHILNFVYNFLSGGESILDIERLQNDNAFKRIIGCKTIPDPTTAGDFLVRFDDSKISDFIKSHRAIQSTAFGLLSPKKKKKATIEVDASVHEVYGRKKEGADFSYNKKWSYHPIYFTLPELGELLDIELRPGNAYASSGVNEKLEEIIKHLESSFTQLCFRADSACYDKNIAATCDNHKVTFYITADQTKKIMTKVFEIEEKEWSPYNKQKRKNKTGKKRKKRANLKKEKANKWNKEMKYKGKSEVAEFTYQPTNWEKEYRFIVKRTKVVDKNGQLFLNNGYSNYRYHIIATSSNEDKVKVMQEATKRSNQENLIKDFKYGLGLKHVPTGFFNANKIYFLIAMLAWNIKTWMLNLLKLGDGSKIRFKRFLYKIIYNICFISNTGKNMIYYRLNHDFYSIFDKALTEIKGFR